MSIDCVDCRIKQKGPTFSSHKFKKKSALRYEVAVAIISGEIAWINGPYPAGQYNNLIIFHESLQTFLDAGERVEADDGYEGEAPLKVKCPSSIGIPEEKHRKMGIVRRRQETVNRRFKQWGILAHKFRHDLGMHGRVFSAIVVISQLAIEHGEPLFQVEYDD